MQNDLTVKRTITIRANKEKVWDALVNPEIIKKYLFGTETISEWKVGSSIVFQGEYLGQGYKDKGTILEFVPNQLFQYNYWSSFSNTEDKLENYSTITFKIDDKEDSTELTLTQNGFASQEQRDHSHKNWEMVLNLMKEIIEK